VPFVANRLAKVHNTFDALKQYQPKIRYVNTRQNPADLLTRPRTVEDFKSEFRFWIQGPDFLMGEKSRGQPSLTCVKRNKTWS
jgi:hypothetical protein